MAVLYSEKEIQDVLRELRIRPMRGLVTTKEVARILSWRAKAEYDIDHSYPEAAVRRHVEKKNLSVAEGSGGRNLFKVEDAFLVPLSPRRGLLQQQEAKEAA